MVQVTSSLDGGKLVEAMKKRTAGPIARRAELLGVQMEKIIQELIDAEVGSSGRAAKRGMISLHSLPWQHDVVNPGQLPVTARLFGEWDAGTTAKFNAHNFGSKPHDIGGAPFLNLGPKSENPSASAHHGGQGNTVVRKVTHPGLPGKQWLRRTAEIARLRAIARFI